MAINVIHGTGKPLIKYGDTFQYSIALPYCESLVEYFALDSFSDKMETGDMRNRKRGWYYKAALNYETYITKEILQSLEPLFNVTVGDFRFFPRSDNVNIYYDVNFPKDFTFSFAQRPHFRGHKGVMLTFEGVKRLSSINLTSTP